MPEPNEIAEIQMYEITADLSEPQKKHLYKYLKEKYPEHYQDILIMAPDKFKDRLPAFIESLHQMIHSYKSNFKQSDKQFDLCNVLDKMAGCMERYFHSTSYAENEPYNFDIIDLISDLEFAIGILKKLQ